MPAINYDSVTFKVGDLVRFIGLNYTPDYYAKLDDEEPIGIVVEVLTIKGVYVTRAWMYRVHWFKVGRVTEAVGGHLRMATGADTA
jgi:hypothetical protein|tara:strand:+ start:439 stop:696 length:258 start_codon:yes stop_codon:yes gene_type:complete